MILNHKLLLHTAQTTHKYLDFSGKKTQYFFAFAILRCCKRSKKVVAQAEGAFAIKHQNSFKYQVVKIDVNVLRIQGLILRTNKAANWQKTKNSQPLLKIH